MAERAEQIYFGRRLSIASIFACLAFSFLIVRLWYLQCVYGGFYRDLSENNRVRTIRTEPPRGTIYDRNEQVLVRNRPAFDVALMLEDTPSIKDTLAALADVTGRDVEALNKQLQTVGRGRHFEPQVVISDVSHEELARVRANGYRLPGVIIRAVPTRAYPKQEVAAQILGYAREINKAQLEVLQDLADYKTGDLIGQAGVEKQWESYLRGRSGYVQVEVDAKGNRRGELGIVDDQMGDDLYLTIDLDLQAKAQEALGERRGAVVALDPRNGEVLVLASSPAYDANIFSGKMATEDWERLTTDKNKPLNNRAIASEYPPGSTFKLFTAIAGLVLKKTTANREIYCPGYYSLGGHNYKCHKHSGHGMVNLERAITVSCNAYFYTLGQELKIEGIEQVSRLFGFGVPTGIELQGEETGILPSDEWKRETQGEKWYPGDTIPVSIGQGYLVVTPIQMAVATAALANQGSIYKPQLVKKIIKQNNSEVIEIQPKLIRKLPYDKQLFDLIKQFAINVVNDKSGTGKRAALPGIVVAGKTGTAQTSALGKERLSELFKDHAWFISFAPADNPTIAMAVIVENSGHGGEFAAPVTRQIMEVYFRKLGMLPKGEILPRAEDIEVEPEEEQFAEENFDESN